MLHDKIRVFNFSWKFRSPLATKNVAQDFWFSANFFEYWSKFIKFSNDFGKEVQKFPKVLVAPKFQNFCANRN